MLSFSHPGSTCLPTIGVWTDFSESAWGVKYAHTLHIHGSALGTPTMEYHSVVNLPCVEKDGMHFHLCKLEGERTQCRGVRRGRIGFEPCELLAAGGD